MFSQIVRRCEDRITSVVATATALTLGVATDAHASQLETFLEKVAKLIKYGALVVGWGLGFFLIVAGVQDLTKSSDDPRAGGKGAKKIAGGVILIGVATLISWAMEHFGLSSNVQFQPPTP